MAHSTYGICRVFNSTQGDLVFGATGPPGSASALQVRCPYLFESAISARRFIVLVQQRQKWKCKPQTKERKEDRGEGSTSAGISSSCSHVVWFHSISGFCYPRSLCSCHSFDSSSTSCSSTATSSDFLFRSTCVMFSSTSLYYSSFSSSTSSTSEFALSSW
jgi:hypothetical protein